MKMNLRTQIAPFSMQKKSILVVTIFLCDSHYQDFKIAFEKNKGFQLWGARIRKGLEKVLNRIRKAKYKLDIYKYHKYRHECKSKGDVSAHNNLGASHPIFFMEVEKCP